MRECLNNEADSLLKPVHPQGDIELRNSIAEYLREFRNMNVSAEQIVLGAGSEYLLGLITEMLQIMFLQLKIQDIIKPLAFYKAAK